MKPDIWNQLAVFFMPRMNPVLPYVLAFAFLALVAFKVVTALASLDRALSAGRRIVACTLVTVPAAILVGLTGGATANWLLSTPGSPVGKFAAVALGTWYLTMSGWVEDAFHIAMRRCPARWMSAGAWALYESLGGLAAPTGRQPRAGAWKGRTSSQPPCHGPLWVIHRDELPFTGPDQLPVTDGLVFTESPHFPGILNVDIAASPALQHIDHRAVQDNCDEAYIDAVREYAGLGSDADSMLVPGLPVIQVDLGHAPHPGYAYGPPIRGATEPADRR